MEALFRTTCVSDCDEELFEVGAKVEAYVPAPDGDREMGWYPVRVLSYSVSGVYVVEFENGGTAECTRDALRLN